MLLSKLVSRFGLDLQLTACVIPIFPAPSSSVGRPKHQKVMMGGLEDADVYIGRKAQELRGLLKIKYPVEHGIVSIPPRRSRY